MLYEVITCQNEVPEGPGDVARIVSEPADNEPHSLSGQVSDRGLEDHHAVGASAERGAVGSVDRDAVDEDDPKIAVLGRSARRNVRSPAGRQIGSYNFV